MVGLGLYLQYKYNLEQSDTGATLQATWFPILCIFSFTICCTIGYLVVPWVMIGELYPQKVRGIVGGMTTFCAHSFVFIVVKTYPMLSHVLQQHGTFILYGCVSLFGKFWFFSLNFFVNSEFPSFFSCRYHLLLLLFARNERPKFTRN